MFENIEQQYLREMKNIMVHGDRKSDRTGTGTISKFGVVLKHDYYNGFPLLTTKKLHIKSIIHELLWFVRGDTNIKYLEDNGVRIWREWADENGELGPVYGKQLRDCGGVDQLQNVIDSIKNNPFSRRHIISLWHPPDIDKMALPPCFPKNTKVLTKEGYKNIENVKVGDKVFTHTGAWRRVYALHETPYDGEVNEIKISYMKDIVCTPNHPFLIKEKGYVEAKDINVGDFVAIKKYVPKNILPKFTYKIKHFNRGLKINRFLKKEFVPTLNDFYMMGFFLGDGWVNHKNKDKKECNFAISSIDKDNVLPKIRRSIKISERFNRKTVSNYSTKSHKWYDILKQFGEGAPNKTIPGWVMDAPQKYREVFLEGYFDADGCFRKGTLRKRFTTTSYELAHKLQLLIMSTNNILCSVKEQDRPNKTVVEGRIVNQLNTFDIEERNGKFLFDDEDFVWVRVRKNNVIKNKEQYVYNIAVEKDETYTVNNIVTHNCHGLVVQFNVRDNGGEYKIDLSTYQRSADWFLGVPFNIASYSFLLYMICEVLGRKYKPGILTYCFGDAHIYSNHFRQCQQQIDRGETRIFPCPSLSFFRDIKSINDFRYEDFVIKNYDCWGVIKGKVSV